MVSVETGKLCKVSVDWTMATLDISHDVENTVEVEMLSVSSMPVGRPDSKPVVESPLDVDGLRSVLSEIVVLGAAPVLRGDTEVLGEMRDVVELSAVYSPKVVEVLTGDTDGILLGSVEVELVVVARPLVYECWAVAIPSAVGVTNTVPESVHLVENMDVDSKLVATPLTVEVVKRS